MKTKTQPIRSQYPNGAYAALVDQDGNPVFVDQVAKTFRGEAYRITGGRAPQHEGSTGKVWCYRGSRKSLNARLSEAEFYPSVFDMRWVPVDGPKR